MEIKIGVNNIPREVSIDAEVGTEQVEQQLRQALAENGVLRLSDAKGRTVIVPAAQVAYLDLGQEHARPVGFGAV